MAGTVNVPVLSAVSNQVNRDWLRRAEGGQSAPRKMRLAAETVAFFNGAHAGKR